MRTIPFSEWVRRQGGVRAAARVLSCSPSFVCMLQTGERRPSLDIIELWERMTRGALTAHSYPPRKRAA